MNTGVGHGENSSDGHLPIAEIDAAFAGLIWIPELAQQHDPYRSDCRNRADADGSQPAARIAYCPGGGTRRANTAFAFVLCRKAAASIRRAPSFGAALRPVGSSSQAVSSTRQTAEVLRNPEKRVCRVSRRFPVGANPTRPIGHSAGSNQSGAGGNECVEVLWCNGSAGIPPHRQHVLSGNRTNPAPSRSLQTPRLVDRQRNSQTDLTRLLPRSYLANLKGTSDWTSPR